MKIISCPLRVESTKKSVEAANVVDTVMSRRASLTHRAEKKSGASEVKGPRVRFPNELIFLNEIKENDLTAVNEMLRRASLEIDINAIGDSGMTPLHQAVVDGNEEAVRLLVSNGCDVNRQDADSWTPLHTACACGHTNISRYLLENGADPRTLTADGERAMDLIEPGDMSTISVVLRHKMEESGKEEEPKRTTD